MTNTVRELEDRITRLEAENDELRRQMKMLAEVAHSKPTAPSAWNPFVQPLNDPWQIVPYPKIIYNPCITTGCTPNLLGQTFTIL